MEFNSVVFLGFLTIVLFLYYLIPGKLRPLLLFISGFYFYMSWNAGYGLLLAAVMGVSYIGACVMDAANDSRRKLILKLCIAFDVLVLFIFKYTGMALGTINDIKRLLTGQEFRLTLNILLPIGISFYIFQSLGYLVDVYRRTIRAEKRFINYGAFVAFFPQLVAGPIERSSNLLKQVNDSKDVRLNQESISKGVLQMLFGYFEKVVIADQIAGVVTKIYSDYNHFGGAYVLLATVLFAFQIYCDFDGYTNIAIGVARLFGIKLIKNFNTPYLAESITDFWRRWHISLSSWLRDYVYISLGGNRGSKAFKYRNILLTFLVSGVWHGANWTFIVWGVFHGLVQIIEDKFNLVKSQGLLSRIAKTVMTFIVADLAWLIFRAESLTHAVELLKCMLMDFNVGRLLDRDTMILLELRIREWIVLVIALVLLVMIDLVKYHLDSKYEGQIEIYDVLYKLPQAVIGVIVILAVVFILVFGHYGPQYDAAQFIYFQF